MPFKKIIPLTLVLGFLVLGTAVGDDSAIPSPDDPDFTLNIAKFIQLDLMATGKLMNSPEGVAMMQEYSVDLDQYYKGILFNLHKKDPTGTAMLNVFTGGIGSWAMGDRLAGAVLTTGGMLVMAMSTMMLPFGLDLGIDTRTLANGAMITGAIVGASGIAVPYISAYFSNKNLKNALSF